MMGTRRINPSQARRPFSETIQLRIMKATTAMPITMNSPYDRMKWLAPTIICVSSGNLAPNPVKII